MNIALLTAGGIGNRMGQDIPKQFMTINEKPVLIYTLEVFQSHPEIDAIAVVCLSGWEPMLQAYANQFRITKLKWIFPGGASNQESIYNGITGLRQNNCKDDDIVIVHDGVRPLISHKIISDNLETCKKFGFAVTGLLCKEVIMEIKDDLVLPIEIPRERLVRTQTPHTYHLGSLIQAHHDAEKKGINDTVAPCDMIAKIGEHSQHLVQGSEKNGLKLTRPEDVDIFKSLVELERVKNAK
jgi:2-C-methyl-D-erythritol 4-phosphate cytidylyltransferase